MCEEQAFPFEDLPKDIRRMIYDCLPERKHRSLLGPKSGLYYEVQSAPVALLCVNKNFNQEVSACLHGHDYAHPIVIFCHADGYHIDGLKYVNLLVSLVELGRKYDKHHFRTNVNSTGPSHANMFDRWTLKIPMMNLDRDLRRLRSFHGLNIREFHSQALESFYKSSLIKYRRHSTCEFIVRWLPKYRTMIGVSACKRKRLQEYLESMVAWNSDFHHLRFLILHPRSSSLQIVLPEKWVWDVERPTDEEKALLCP
ncbi:hypothetical protein C7974DRAFT_377729 [Boeremia exigua]|uniref:uncharacterized protein n=1 Tax=Boeremia exigua TaxID=749465 RepID=UPI001E8DF998|nr:uncharacterized protein C7974DRAFT_377729 [Boeremia exigua]KAH6622117.1 hypothetical protein C7974DRAFT_377729 [Boeremia exigua]